MDNYRDMKDKSHRLLALFERLVKRESIMKHEMAEYFDITPKTIQRDIESLEEYFQLKSPSEKPYITLNEKGSYELIYPDRDYMTNSEILAVCKILLESRAFNKEEMNQLIEKLLFLSSDGNRKDIDTIIKNELFHYVPLKHGKNLIHSIWELSKTINNHRIISFHYTNQENHTKEYTVKPVALLFSEFYFYLICYMDASEYDFPFSFRVDRIDMNSLSMSNERFSMPYATRFKDGEFRKRVQFMYAGDLCKVQFDYVGPSVEAILDRLPTAKIMAEKEGTYTIKAETYGKGINMWLRSQGEYVTNIQFL